MWLNETQNYLSGHGDTERVAAKLRGVLADSARGPVLVLGTLWPEHHDVLARKSGSQERLLLEGTVIDVPDAFTGPDLEAVTHAATQDARLAQAAEHAPDGQITQYLAAGPSLLERFHTAPATAKAIILTAMDACRLGHRNALPLSLLEHAAPSYLTDAQWNQLGADWLDEALDYTSHPCKGALGPITRIRPGRASAHPAPRNPSLDIGEDQPLYRLADYLDHYGRTLRAAEMPPAGFWAAATSHANPGDMAALGRSAWGRGLYRDAVSLFKSGTTCGEPGAALELVERLHSLHPSDLRPAQWAADHVAVHHNLYSVGILLERLHKMEAGKQAFRLAERIAAHMPLDRPYDVGRSLEQFRLIGATDSAKALLARDPASHVTLDDPFGLTKLLEQLDAIGATDHAAMLVARDPASKITLDNMEDVVDVLKQLHKVGATDQATILAERAVAQCPLDLLELDELLSYLHETGAADLFTGLVERATAHLPIDDPGRVAGLLRRLRNFGASDQAMTLMARNPAAHVTLDNVETLERLIERFHEFGATDQIAELVERAAIHFTLHEYTLERLLTCLHRVDADDQAAKLAERLLAAGCFVTFVRIGKYGTRFQFGRELNKTAAAPWDWDDLE